MGLKFGAVSRSGVWVALVMKRARTMQPHELMAYLSDYADGKMAGVSAKDVVDQARETLRDQIPNTKFHEGFLSLLDK